VLTRRKKVKRPEEVCAQTPKSSVVLAFAHAFASFTAGVATVELAGALRSTSTPAEGPGPAKASNPVSSHGMRQAVVLNVRPALS